MAIEIVMPQLGESVVDGTVGEWLKRIGDTVEEFEPIVRVSTDKVDSEIPSPANGVLLAIHIPEGETVNAGVVLGIVGQVGEQTPSGGGLSGTTTHSNGQDNGHHAPAVAAPSRGMMDDQGAHISPVVARMATEHRLDLSQIKGSGRNGRITKKDVLAFMENPTAVVADIPPWEQPGSGDLFKPTVEYTLEPAKAAPSPAAPSAMPPTSVAKTATPVKATTEPMPNGIPGELQSLSTMRRSIAEHMVRSKLQTAPHVTTVFEVDLSAVVAHRDAHKAEFEKKGVKLTFTPYFVMASAAALLEYPSVNARWTDEGLYVHRVCNVGMAVAIADGLIVPVIKNAQDYNLIGLARQVNDLAERARNKQLKADEVRDGTFTITNHGVTGSLFATPIINQPQSAILGVGAIEKRVKVIGDAIAIRPCVYLSLTFDHRVIDGAGADNFMSAIKRALETWS